MGRVSYGAILGNHRLEGREYAKGIYSGINNIVGRVEVPKQGYKTKVYIKIGRKTVTWPFSK